MEHVAKFLDQFVRLVGRLAYLANHSDGFSLFLIEIGLVTSEQPDGIFS